MDKLVLSTPNSKDFGLGTLMEIRSFPDGDNYVRIVEDCEEKDVVLIHRCYPNQDRSLMQLFLAIRQIKEMKAKAITVVIPYLPYARQDKRFLEGEVISSEAVCSMLKLLGCSKLVTFDCHFLKKEGEFTYAGLRIVNKSLACNILDYLKPKCKNPLVISPDEGARYLIEKEKGVVMKKVRGEYNHGEYKYRDIESISLGQDVSGREIIIIDDMISTGSTIIKAVEACKEAGAKSVYCCTTHGLFLNNSLSKILRLGVKEVVATNTIISQASRIDISEVIKELL